MKFKRLLAVLMVSFVFVVSMSACNSSYNCCKNGKCECSCCQNKDSSSGVSTEESEALPDESVDSQIVAEPSDEIKATKVYKYFDKVNIDDDVKITVTSNETTYKYFVSGGEMVQYVNVTGDNPQEGVQYSKGDKAYIVDITNKQYRTYDLTNDEKAMKSTYLSNIVKTMFTSIEFVDEKDGYEVFKFITTDSEEKNGVDSTEKSVVDDIEPSKKSTSSGATASSASTDSSEVSDDASEIVTPEYLYMKVEKDGVLVESRDSKGEILDSSKYSVSKVTESDKKVCSIEGCKEIKGEDVSNLPNVPDVSEDTSKVESAVESTVESNSSN